MNGTKYKVDGETVTVTYYVTGTFKNAWEENEQQKYSGKVGWLRSILYWLKVGVYVLALRLHVGWLFGLRKFKSVDDLVSDLEHDS